MAQSVSVIDEHFALLVNSDLNKAISHLLKAEKLFDITNPVMVRFLFDNPHKFF